MKNYMTKRGQVVSLTNEEVYDLTSKGHATFNGKIININPSFLEWMEENNKPYSLVEGDIVLVRSSNAITTISKVDGQWVTTEDCGTRHILDCFPFHPLSVEDVRFLQNSGYYISNEVSKLLEEIGNTILHLAQQTLN